MAEREVFLSTKKLANGGEFRIDDVQKERHFTEMLQEEYAGLSIGDGAGSPGFGCERESYKVGPWSGGGRHR